MKKTVLKAKRPSDEDTAKDERHGIKSLFPALFIIAIAIVIIYSLSFIGGEQSRQPSPAQGEQKPSCVDGQTRYCVAGNCSGTSLCVSGMWGGCGWKQTCTPGSRIPCLSASCPYGVKQCNACGNGYGPCTAP